MGHAVGVAHGARERMWRRRLDGKVKAVPCRLVLPMVRYPRLYEVNGGPAWAGPPNLAVTRRST